jgi:uncharacterized membrane protein YbhN (UPF0104 family)
MTALGQSVRKLLANKKVQFLFNGTVGLVLLGVSVLSARHFMHQGWPLHRANYWLVGVAALLYGIAYAFKAWGWQRLFRDEDRPSSHALAFAGASACVGGVALPGRLDDAVRIACVKKFPGTKASLGTLALSLLILGMLDNAALAPMASIAAADADSWSVRLGFALVAVGGVAAAVVVAMVPKFSSMRRVMKFRLGRWLAEHTQCRRESIAALILISVSWTLRATAVFLLLNALSVKGSYILALGFVCASAASAALPIGPAGAAMQAGAGATLLALNGVDKADAVAFSVAAQALIVVTGAAVILLIGAWQLALRFSRFSPRRARLAPAAR